MRKTVVIPAAGLGSRLDEFTKNYNKAMCTLGPKPVISYIIEKFTKDDNIIILLGYKGDLLKQVLKIAYPDWKITFVEVDNFEGPGSGLGYSLSCAEHLLQRPFIFWSNDTVIDDDISKFDYSSSFMVLADFRPDLADQYRHAAIGDDRVLKILPKGEYDPRGKNTLPYIGISYINDPVKFWSAFHENREIFIEAGESAGLNKIFPMNYYVTHTWVDTGNKKELVEAKKKFDEKMEETILEKPDEAIWFFDDRVVKFHIDPKFISGRVKRFKLLVNDNMAKAGIRLPELLTYDKNVYSYRRAPGHIMSKRVTPANFIHFLSKYFDNVDVSKYVNTTDETKLNIVNDFYRDKTLSRIDKFCKTYEELDGECSINDLNCGSAKQLIENIDWEYVAKKTLLSDNYHGDFHLENVLVNKLGTGCNEYILLDWRQNFGKTDVGDLYYDLAKMWHSLIVNHNFVKEGRFEIKMRRTGSIIIDINRSFIDTECEANFKKYLTDHKMFDVTHAQFLTALIFLNICACHTSEYARFLFYLGKYLMNQFIQEHPRYLKKK